MAPSEESGDNVRAGTRTHGTEDKTLDEELFDREQFVKRDVRMLFVGFLMDPYWAHHDLIGINDSDILWRRF